MVLFLLLYNFVKKGPAQVYDDFQQSISDNLLIMYVSFTSSHCHVLKYPFNKFLYYLESVTLNLHQSLLTQTFLMMAYLLHDIWVSIRQRHNLFSVKYRMCCPIELSAIQFV